jgi:molybdopterin/thiamine biosynthesis adenylyltransferase
MRKIVIVGVGALGSHAVLFLRSAGHERGAAGHEIVAIDFDRVEQKNTLAQFHSKATVGKNKALSLQQSISFLFGVRISAVPHELTKDNAQALLGGAALVIDCLDNAPSRRIVQASVRELGIPCLHGALAANGGVGRVVWDDKFQIDEDDGPGATCEDGAHLPFIGIVSAHVARAAQQFLATGQQMSFQVFARSPSTFV